MTVASSASSQPRSGRRAAPRWFAAALGAALVLAATAPAEADSILVIGQAGNETFVTSLRASAASASPSDTFTDGGSNSGLSWAGFDQIWFIAGACDWDTVTWPTARFISHLTAGGTLFIVNEFFGPPKFAGCDSHAELTTILAATLNISVVSQPADNDTPGFADPGYCNEPVVVPTGSGVLSCPNVITTVPAGSCGGNLSGVPESLMIRRRATTGLAAGAVFGPAQMTTGVGRLITYPDMTGLPSGNLLANLVEFGRTTPSGACLYCTGASDCPSDSNQCTTDACSSTTGLCTYAPVAAGSTCTGGVCNGAPAECVVCLDDGGTSRVDSGCSASAPHCEGSGTSSAICQACIDTVSGGPDLGCTGTSQFCLEVGTTGLNACMPCEADIHCDDRIDCTLDRCVPFPFSTMVIINRCEHTPIAAGTSCTGGVCDGMVDCVPCVDDSATGLDSGCAAGAPNCEGAGTSSAICQPCIDTVSGGPDLGCAGTTPFCVAVSGGPNACIECLGASDCDDTNDCTADACTAGSCSHTPVSAGTTCTGGVCNGAPAECVTCFDDSASGTDTGCASGAPNCQGSGTSGAICQPCVDSASGGTDLGCTGAQPNCVAVSGGPNACIECLAASDCDDSNECTVDACAAGACTNTSSDAGTTCSTGVCDGASSAPACVECVSDAQCGGATSLCNTTTNTCQGCLSAGDCDDSNECTTDSCDGTGLCAHDALAAGTACTDGVCAGASATCVGCIDSSVDGTDDGCADTSPYCDATATTPSCEICEDSSADGVDRGCSDADPFCVDDGSGGRECVPCDPCEDAGTPMPDAGVPDAGEPDAGRLPGAVSGGALCRVAPSARPSPFVLWAMFSGLGLFVARRRRRG